MAQGDVFVFNEAKAYLIDGGFEPADVIKCAILDNTAQPSAGFATPALGDFAEVTAAGTYTSGGTELGSLGGMTTETGGTMTFDSAVNPSWAADASNATDAHFGLIYNNTDAGNRAIAYVDLNGPVDMVTTTLSITWSAGGIFQF